MRSARSRARGLVEAFPPAPAAWPWATLIANLAGAAVLGYAVVRLGGELQRLRFVGTGFCGALTTFSALQIELLLMLDDGAYGLAAGYAAVSIAAGLACIAAGMRAARRGVPA